MSQQGAAAASSARYVVLSGINNEGTSVTLDDQVVVEPNAKYVYIHNYNCFCFIITLNNPMLGNWFHKQLVFYRKLIQ